MCACRQKKSFLIKDILGEVSVKNNTYKSNDYPKPLSCNRATKHATIATGDATKDKNTKTNTIHDEKAVKFNVVCEVQKELDLNSTKVNLEQRRNTFPLYPTPVKANPSWPVPAFRLKDVSYPMEPRHSFSYFSDPMLNADQILRNQLATSSYLPHHLLLRQPMGFDRGEIQSNRYCMKFKLREVVLLCI